MISVRLTRLGRKNRPFYRIVAADSRAPVNGKFLEQLGYYDPLCENEGKKVWSLNQDRLQYWMSNGARVSYRIQKFLDSQEGTSLTPKRKPKYENFSRKAIKEAKKAGKLEDLLTGKFNSAGTEEVIQEQTQEQTQEQNTGELKDDQNLHKLQNSTKQTQSESDSETTGAETQTQSTADDVTAKTVKAGTIAGNDENTESVNAKSEDKVASDQTSSVEVEESEAKNSDDKSDDTGNKQEQ